MKEYVCKEDLENLPKYNFGVTLLSAEEHIKISDIANCTKVTKADICRVFTQKFVERLNYQTRIPHSFAIYVNETISQVLAEMEQE